jgi:hypothetical protein
VSDITNKPRREIGASGARPAQGWLGNFLELDDRRVAICRARSMAMCPDASERERCAVYHAPLPATGFIAGDGASYQFVPTTWAPQL